jgi:hypothetical protein
MSQQINQALREQEAKKIALVTTLLTLILLAAGLLVVWVAQKHLDIKGDSVYVALLLVPVVVYLLVTGQLGELKLPGVTLTAIRKEIENVRSDVADVGELEPERSTYLGKLRQVQAKDGVDFCLIYADVEGLRLHARKLFLKQHNASGDNSSRKSEKELRDSVIQELAFLLTDAFYGTVPEAKGAKHDIFFLEEPDIAMIARKVSRDEAQAIAASAARKFVDVFGYRASMVVVRPSAGMSPRELDRAAATRLADS